MAFLGRVLLAPQGEVWRHCYSIKALVICNLPSTQTVLVKYCYGTVREPSTGNVVCVADYIYPTLTGREVKLKPQEQFLFWLS